jgi:hypothetical protein
MFSTSQAHPPIPRNSICSLTSASVLSRLEGADYQGHSLAMLRRIAAALNQRVEIHFVPVRRPAFHEAAQRGTGHCGLS